MIDWDVPVNTGGACGGVLNAFGAIENVESGWNVVGVGLIDGLEMKGRIWENMVDALEKRVGSARISAMTTKRKRETREYFKRLETARLNDLNLRRPQLNLQNLLSECLLAKV